MADSSDQPPRGRCNHVYQRGQHIGKRCSSCIRKANSGGYCSKHNRNHIQNQTPQVAPPLPLGEPVSDNSTRVTIQQPSQLPAVESCGVAIFCNSQLAVGYVNDIISQIHSHPRGTPADIIKFIQDSDGAHLNLQAHLFQMSNDPLEVGMISNISHSTQNSLSQYPHEGGCTNVPSDTVCSICIDPIHTSPAVVTMCGHSFHRHCIHSYFEKTHNTHCPNCRHQEIHHGLSAVNCVSQPSVDLPERIITNYGCSESTS